MRYAGGGTMAKRSLAALWLTVGLGLIAARPSYAEKHAEQAKQKVMDVATRNHDAYLSGDAAAYARQLTSDGAQDW
jgi:hypothetical protein